MGPAWIEKRCPKAQRLHQVIQNQSPSSAFCPFCGTQWPEPVEVNDSDTEPPRTTSRSSSQVFGPPAAKPPRNQRDRTSNFKAAFEGYAQDAAQACRPQKITDPYTNPAGLLIRLISLVTFGQYQDAFFIPGKTNKLVTVDLDPLPLAELSAEALDFAMAEEDWIVQYIHPSFPTQFASNTPYELGKSWSKQAGFNRLPHPRPGATRTVADLFSKGSIDWEVQDGRLLVWLNFMIVEDGGSPVRTRKRILSDEKDDILISTKEETPSQKEPSSDEPPFPIFPIKRSRSESPLMPSTPRTISPVEHLETGPAFHTRRVQTRRPPQKKRKVVRKN